MSASHSMRRGRLRSKRLLESYRHEFGYAHFFHGHAVKRARGFHRALIVRDDDELSTSRHLHYFIGEATDVGFIKGRVNFVEQAER